MCALNKQPSPQGEDEQIANELDGNLEKVIARFRGILENPHKTDEIATLEALSKELIDIDSISQKAADLEC